MVVVQQPAESLAALHLARRFADLLAGIEDGVAKRLMISFNMVMSEPLPDGVTTTDTYDSLNRLTKVVHEHALGQVLAEYDYTLRADGTRSKDVETELESDATYSTRTFDWVYDQLGRLTEEKLTSTLSGESYTDDYTYSLVGNRVEMKAAAANGTVTDTTSSYNARGQILQENAVVSGSTTTTNFQYDANGSLTSKITVGGNSYGYTYNLRNQLATATIDRTEQGHAVHLTASYKYDDAGIRVENDETTTIDNGAPTTQTKLFLIDGNNPTGYAQVLEQLAAAAGQAVMSYIFGHQPLGQTDSSGATKYTLADGHDSTRLLIDAAGNIAARFLYDAYGDMLGLSPGVLNLPATSILYTGQQFDPVLLQYYLRARYYDPQSGTFNAVDPFPGDATVPATLHRYIYGGNDPIDNGDPTGQFLMSLVGFAQNMAYQTSYNLAIGGIGAEAMLAVALYGFWEDMQILAGIDPQTGGEASYASQGMALIFLAFDVTPVGKVVHRVLPAWVQDDIGQWGRWMANLIQDHSKHGPPGKGAMASALQFSEEIIQGTLRADKAGTEGADIVAEAIEDGVQGVLKREVSTLYGKATSLYGKIINHEAKQVNGATFPQVFVEVTDDVLAQPDAINIIRQNAQSAQDAMRTYLGYGERSKVFVVRSDGDQIFP